MCDSRSFTFHKAQNERILLLIVMRQFCVPCHHRHLTVPPLLHEVLPAENPGVQPGHPQTASPKSPAACASTKRRRASSSRPNFEPGRGTRRPLPVGPVHKCSCGKAGRGISCERRPNRGPNAREVRSGRDPRGGVDANPGGPSPIPCLPTVSRRNRTRNPHTPYVQQSEARAVTFIAPAPADGRSRAGDAAAGPGPRACCAVGRGDVCGEAAGWWLLHVAAGLRPGPRAGMLAPGRLHQQEELRGCASPRPPPEGRVSPRHENPVPGPALRLAHPPLAPGLGPFQGATPSSSQFSLVR